MTAKLAAISVDLDELDCYAAIHGIDQSQCPSGLVYNVALPRFEALFGELGLHATLFAIGRDLESRQNAQTIRKLHEAGHEIGNHSYDHAYNLTRRLRQGIHDDIARGAAVIEHIIGEPPQGFRAPGYTVNDTVFDVLQALDTRYDSSVFPCPIYYSAKAAAMTAIRLRGRTSHSVLDDPRVLGAPADPYRVGLPYYQRGDGMIELPIGVTPTLRLPYIGTTVLTGGTTGATFLSNQMSSRSFVNLELHGIDMLDVSDGLHVLAKHQADVRVSVAQKRRALIAAVTTLRDRGFSFVTLAQAATRVSTDVSDS